MTVIVEPIGAIMAPVYPARYEGDAPDHLFHTAFDTVNIYAVADDQSFPFTGWWAGVWADRDGLVIATTTCLYPSQGGAVAQAAKALADVRR